MIDKCSTWVQITEIMCDASYVVPNKKKTSRIAKLQMTSTACGLKH
jgi:hypothetical protein